MQHGEGQTDKTYGPRTFKTPAFFEMGARVAYNIPLYKTYTLQLHAGVQNMFNAFQDDFDRGPSRGLEVPFFRMLTLAAAPIG